MKDLFGHAEEFGLHLAGNQGAFARFKMRDQ